MEDNVLQLSKYIKESNRIVFFGGAGVSTESGIPDFRSTDGLYKNADTEFSEFSPEYYLSHTCLMKNPEAFYRFYKKKMDTRSYEPNSAHKVLARLEEEGKLSAVITQNIDGLHQKAGSKTVHEIHGTTARNYCMKCGMEYHQDFLFDTQVAVPACECGGLIRPDVTLYEEELPTDAVRNALLALSKADLLIVAGTSLSVYPAASFLSYYEGEHIVVINKEPVALTLSPDNDLFICGSIGEILTKVERLL